MAGFLLACSCTLMAKMANRQALALALALATLMPPAQQLAHLAVLLLLQAVWAQWLPLAAMESLLQAPWRWKRPLRTPLLQLQRMSQLQLQRASLPQPGLQVQRRLRQFALLHRLLQRAPRAPHPASDWCWVN